MLKIVSDEKKSEEIKTNLKQNFNNVMDSLKRFILTVMVMVTVLIQGCVADKEPDGASLEPGDSLPQFSLTLSTGQYVDTQTLIGKLGIIIFFNTNCRDCQKELPVINDLWERYRYKNEVIILAVSREEGEEEIKEYWEANNLTMPYSAQKNREIYSLFAKNIIPRIYISDFSGKIIFMSDDSDLPTLQSLIEVIEKNT